MREAYKAIPLMLWLSACAHADNPQPPPPAAPPPAVTPAAKAAPVDARTGVGFVGAGIEPEAPKVIVKETVDPYQPIRIRVTGQGTVPASKSLSPSQRKLLAIRAAKLDAFRAIAEQVQGMKLVGNSSVANMVSVSDSFRTYVDAYLRGVNIVTSSIQGDGSSEVIAEIVLDKDFYLQFKTALQQTGSVMKAAQQSGAQGVQCGADNSQCTQAPPAARYGSNFYNEQ